MSVHFRSFLFLSLLFVVSFCNADQQIFEVVGFGECADCKENNFNDNDAFSGLQVTIDCKLKAGGIKRLGATELDEQGKFKLQLPREAVEQASQTLKQECYAQLHSAAAVPCPAHGGLETTKITFKSHENGKLIFSPAKHLQFSTPLCTSKFMWKKKFPKLPFPIYKPESKPPVVKPLPPPIPVHKPKKPILPPAPVYKPKPKPQLVKPLPPPIPVHKPEKPILPPVPVYKPKPKLPVVKPLPPPIPIHKPKPKPKKPIFPPTPVHKSKPKAPVVKPLPPPTPVHKPKQKPKKSNKPADKSKPKPKKPILPPAPVHKPEPKPPVTKPLPPSLPPFPITPIYKNPCPPLPKIPPKYFHHPKIGYFPPPAIPRP